MALASSSDGTCLVPKMWGTVERKLKGAYEILRTMEGAAYSSGENRPTNDV